MGWTYTQPADWKPTRRRILIRDGGRCHVCGQLGADEVDHVQPVSQGGSHEDSNLAAIHAKPCHAVKSERERLTGVAARSRKRPARRNPNVL